MCSTTITESQILFGFTLRLLVGQITEAFAFPIWYNGEFEIVAKINK